MVEINQKKMCKFDKLKRISLGELDEFQPKFSIWDRMQRMNICIEKCELCT